MGSENARNIRSTFEDGADGIRLSGLKQRPPQQSKSASNPVEATGNARLLGRSVTVSSADRRSIQVCLLRVVQLAVTHTTRDPPRSPCADAWSACCDVPGTCRRPAALGPHEPADPLSRHRRPPRRLLSPSAVHGVRWHSLRGASEGVPGGARVSRVWPDAWSSAATAATSTTSIAPPSTRPSVSVRIATDDMCPPPPSPGS